MIDDLDLSKYDNGIIQTLREVVLMGTEGIEEKVLLSNNYSIEPRHPNLAMKTYFSLYSVCYRKKGDKWDLLVIARK